MCGLNCCPNYEVTFKFLLLTAVRLVSAVVDESDLGDRLVAATAALVDPLSRFVFLVLLL